MNSQSASQAKRASLPSRVAGLAFLLLGSANAASADFEAEANWGFNSGLGYRQPHVPEEGLTVSEVSIHPTNPNRFAVAGSLADSQGRERAIAIVYESGANGAVEVGRTLASDDKGFSSRFNSIAWSAQGALLACGEEVGGIRMGNKEASATQPGSSRAFWASFAQNGQLTNLSPCDFSHEQALVARADPNASESSIFWVLTQKRNKGHLRLMTISSEGVVTSRPFETTNQPVDLLVGKELVVIANPSDSGTISVFDINGEKLGSFSPSSEHGRDYFSAVAGDANGNFYVTGRRRAADEVRASEMEDFVLWHFKRGGNGRFQMPWKVTGGSGSGREWGRDVAVLPNGDILATGSFAGTMILNGAKQGKPRLLGSSGQGALSQSVDDQEGFLARFKPDGSLLWAQTSGYLGNDFSNEISIGSDASGVFAYLSGESKKSIGFGPHLQKCRLTGAHDAPFADSTHGNAPTIFWNPPETLRLGEPLTANYLAATTSVEFEGSFSYTLNNLPVTVGSKPFFTPGPITLKAIFQGANGQTAQLSKTLEGLKGRLYLEVSSRQIGAFDSASGNLPSFELTPTISGHHAQKTAGEVAAFLINGNADATFAGNVLQPKKQGKFEVFFFVEEDAFYESSERLVEILVGDGSSGTSESIKLQVVDINGKQPLRRVPKGETVTISASLGFGSNRAFERWVEFRNNEFTTARVQSPFDFKTSVVVDEDMTILARYNFSFVGSAVNGYLAGSMVFLDLNGNGEIDFGEPFVFADESGRFELDFEEEIGLGIDRNWNGMIDPNEATLVVSGGTDRASGLDFEIAYKAPPSYEVVTAVTTLVAELVEQGVALTQAENMVREGLGIPNTVNLGTFEPLLAAYGNQSMAILLLRKATQLANFLNEGSRALAVESGHEDHRMPIANLLVNRLAQDLAQPDQGINLVSQSYLNAILAGVTLDLPPPATADKSRTVRAKLSAISEVEARSASALSNVASTIAEANKALDDMASSNQDAFSYKGLAAGIQIALNDLLEDAANRLHADERQQLETLVNSPSATTAPTLLATAERILDMSPSNDAEPISFDAAAVAGLALPNAFAPVIITESLAAPFDQNQGLVIGSVVAYDPEQGQVSFALVEGNPDLDGDGVPSLQVNETTGELSVADFGDLEFMDENNLSPVIQAMDQDGLYSRKTIPTNLREWSFQAGRPRDAIIVTRPAGNVSVAGATLHAELIGTGGQAPWRKGFEVSTDINFQQNVVELECSSDGNTFSFQLWSLYAETNYYYRSFMETSAGRSYGNKKRFRTKENSMELLLKDAVYQGSGWWGTWFGFTFLAENGWMFHWDLGWVYTTVLDSDQLWLWFPEIGWTWLTSTTYPYFYDYRKARWLYLSAADASTVIFFDYNARSILKIRK